MGCPEMATRAVKQLLTIPSDATWTLYRGHFSYNGIVSDNHMSVSWLLASAVYMLCFTVVKALACNTAYE